MNTHIHFLEEKFHQNANEPYAQKMRAYMKEKSFFYGIRGPIRNDIFREWYKTLPTKNPNFDYFELAVELWDREEREWQHIAMDLLKKLPQRKFKKEDIFTLERLLISKSWWDSVDILASNPVSVYFKQFPEEIENIITDWRHSDNMWLNRTCLIFQLKYKDKTDFELLKSLVKQYQPIKAFFIQKAIGWSLRQYTRYEPQLVIDFVEEISLEGLARREALRLVG